MNTQPVTTVPLLPILLSEYGTAKATEDVLRISKLQNDGYIGSGKTMGFVLDLVGKDGTHEPLNQFASPFLIKVRAILTEMLPTDTKIDFVEKLAQLIEEES